MSSELSISKNCEPVVSSLQISEIDWICNAKLPMLLLIAILTFSPRVFGQSDTVQQNLELDIVQLKEKFQQIALAAKETIDIVSEEPIDVKSLQIKLGTDKAVLRNWVSDNVRWVPYIGALKGAEGTFLARQGSSLDRALLLEQLFAFAGYETRLRRVEISELERASLYKKAIASFNSKQWQVSYQQYIKKHRGLFIALVNKDVYGDLDLADSTKFDLRAREYHRSQLSLLKSLVPEIDTPVEIDSIKSKFLNALGDVFWVELKNSDNTWEAHSVMHEGAPGSTIVRGKVLDINALPTEFIHAIKLEVEIDVLAFASNNIRTETVFDYSLLPYQRLVQPIFLQMQPSNASTVGAILNKIDPDTPIEHVLSDEYQQHNAWVPTLIQQNGEVIRQRGFTPDGEVFEFEENMLGNLDAATRASLSSAIEALASDQNTDKPEESVFAVRQVWTLHSPGNQPRAVKRTIYQMNPDTNNNPERRKISLAQAMSRQSGLLIQNGRIPWALVEMELAKDFLHHHFNLRYLLNKIGTPETELTGIIDAVSSRPIYPKDLLMLAALRNEGLQSGFLHETNILTSIQEVHIDKSGDAIAYVEAIDIVNNTCSYSDTNERLSRVSSGIWDTVSESALHSDSSTVRNTALSMHELTASQLELIAQDTELEIGRFSESQYRAMIADLEQGYWLVVPKAEISIRGTWWRIKMDDGTTLGQLMIGYDVGGGNNAETAIGLRQRVVIWAATWAVEASACLGAGLATGTPSSNKVIVCAICATIKAAIKRFTLFNPTPSLYSEIAGLGKSAICATAGIIAR